MSLYSTFSRKGPSGFGYASTAEDVTAGLPLSKTTVLITGCNSGLGLEAMRVLALRGVHVIGVARTLDKAQAACAMIKGRTTAVACDLSDPASIAQCIANVISLRTGLDAVICNAGIMALPQLTLAHGYELQFFTNHIGHFILVNGLLGTLTGTGRVVVLSSAAHRSAPKGGIQFDNLSGQKSYRPWVAYGQSKFANLLFAKELARRLSGSGKTANAVHPGVIHTNLFRNMGASALSTMLYGIGDALFMKTIPQGAATECFVALNPSAANLSGMYFSNCNPSKPRADAEDPELAGRLWDVSERIAAAG